MVVFTVLLGHRCSRWSITGIGQVAFHDKADGSIIERNGKAVGSSLIGQAFTTKKGDPLPKYFQSRPSAAAGASGSTAAGYDPTLSSGSNLGPTNPDFLKRGHTTGQGLPEAQRPLAEREGAGRRGDRVRLGARPPHLGRQRPAAGPRGSPTSGGSPSPRSTSSIDDNTTGRALGILGEKAVNVLELNLALDQLTGKSSSG